MQILSDLGERLRQQRQAFLADGAPSLAERKQHLALLRKLVLANRTAFQNAVSEDFGYRPTQETDLMELVVVIQTIDYLGRNLASFMRPKRRHVPVTLQQGRAMIEYQPLGVIGIMAPWNYPLSLTLVPLATALAAGNRAMIKPSEMTPATSALLAQILPETFGPDRVSVIEGGREVADAFSSLPFDHLLFTGSTRVGRAVMRAASENLTPVTLELGGKSPVIVERGHATEKTVASIAFGKLANGGQTCVAPDYALVHESEIENFVAHFAAAVSRLYPDGPQSADYCTIAHDGHFQRLNAMLDEARAAGARVLPVGEMPETAGNRLRTLAPTLVLDAGAGLRVMTEEIFGPILPIVPYRTLDEAIAVVNANSHPLALYFFGEDQGEARRQVVERTRSGNVGINNTLLHFVVEDLPFGGTGASGMGAYHGREGFEALSHAKGIFIQGRFGLPSLLRAPYGRLVDLALGFLLRS